MRGKFGPRQQGSGAEARVFARGEPLPDFGAVLVAGVDEAGRGTLAGPVMAAAVVLPRSRRARGYRDSKRLDADERTRLCRLIRREAIACAVGRVEAAEIDEMNILRASLTAMARAVAALRVRPGLVLIDGNRVPGLDLPCYAVVGGDDRVEVISAASIVAKVERDRAMLRLHERYPAYNFAAHKGYPTREHVQNLDRHGVCSAHRKSYRPVRERLAGRALSARGGTRG